MDEIMFDGRGRFRVSDNAYVMTYRSIKNYESSQGKKPTRDEVLGILRLQYGKRMKLGKSWRTNAFWYKIHEDAGVWKVRYGFGEATYNNGRAIGD